MVAKRGQRKTGSATRAVEAGGGRRRLSRDDRQRQLLDVAWQVTGAEGTEALTLGRLAERAGVTKPIVYDHFGTRAGLLAALYREFDTRQTAIMDAALDASAPTLIDRAAVIASSYIDCVLQQGREIPGIIAALASSRELDQVKREYEAAFMEKCRRMLAPFTGTGTLTPAGLRAMLGAAEALSSAAATGEITAAQAQRELFDTILAMVERSARAATDRGRADRATAEHPAPAAAARKRATPDRGRAGTPPRPRAPRQNQR